MGMKTVTEYNATISELPSVVLIKTFRRKRIRGEEKKRNKKIKTKKNIYRRSGFCPAANC